MSPDRRSEVLSNYKAPPSQTTTNYGGGFIQNPNVTAGGLNPMTSYDDTAFHQNRPSNYG